MERHLVETTETDDGGTTFAFHDSLDFEHAQAVWEDLLRSLKKRPPKLVLLDFQDVSNIDSAGLALLRLLLRHCKRRGVEVRFHAVPKSAEYFMRFLDTEGGQEPEKGGLRFTEIVEVIGKGWLRSRREWGDLVQFIGAFFLASASGMVHFRRARWRETIYYAQLAGAEAMPIVFLLSFLLGLVMAFQAAVQLKQFGANIFVADLVSLALTRELGPVFTAVILAGRSGSAFAAEIGTMKVNEEVDALRVMGFDITNFLVLPKVYALAICGPLLTLFANASGIFGGLVVGVLGLDLTAASFIEETYQILTLGDVVGGLAKSLAFAVLIGLIGCLRGLQAEKGADSVGKQTTSAVVSGIFLIIMADAVFTVLYHVFGW
jgi:phospholipid/cholesterol/gamma-HCH transport system permease protein